MTQGLSDSSRSTVRAILSSIQELTLAHTRGFEDTLASRAAWVSRLRLHYQFHPLFFLSSKLETTAVVAYNPNGRGWKRTVVKAGRSSTKTNERLRKWRCRMMKNRKPKNNMLSYAANAGRYSWVNSGNGISLQKKKKIKQIQSDVTQVGCVKRGKPERMEWDVLGNTRDHMTTCCGIKISVTKCPTTFPNFNTACGGKKARQKGQSFFLELRLRVKFGCKLCYG